MNRVEAEGQRARALMAEKVKPHIFRANYYYPPLWWGCSSIGGGVLGLGLTPRAAYRDWYSQFFDLRGGE